MNKDEIRSDFFETSDLPLATTLAVLGFSLHHLDASNPSRVRFFFNKTTALEKTLAKFWIGRIVVEPKAFWNTQRELKSRIRAEGFTERRGL